MARLRAGSLVADRYKIERLLSRGGQASVYVAHDVKFDERVALKVAEADSDSAYERLRERFRREARIGNRLGRTHGFVRAFDYGELEQRRLYLAVDLVEGAAALDLEGGSRADRLARLRDAARIVAEAHRQGIVHRDIKPENFLQAPDGTIKLADFGLAKVRGEAALAEAGPPRRAPKRAAGLTRTGDWQGTPLFMAPEQFEDMKGADERVDVYALGVMLFYALTGKYPYDRGVLKRQRKVREGLAEAPRARELAPDVSPGLDLLCARAMAVDKDERLPGVEAFVDGLEAALAASDGGAPRRAPLLPVRAEEAAISGRIARRALRASPPTPPQGIRIQTGGKSQKTPPPRQKTPAGGIRPTARADGLDRAGDPPALPRGLRRGDRPGEFINRRDGSVLVWIPPGAWTMGTDAPDAWDNERPAHAVRLTRGLFLARTPVTWAQYRRYCQKAGVTPPEPRVPVSEDHPIHDVSWVEAQAYCEWAGARLPTEAEWEWAARGADGRRYPWGDAEPTARRCQWQGGGAVSTAPVGSFPDGASPFGVLDQAGNLWEWVADIYAPFAPGALVDPTGAATGKYHVCRGGAWSSPTAYLRATARCGISPRVRSPNVGFRLARSLGESTRVDGA